MALSGQAKSVDLAVPAPDKPPLEPNSHQMLFGLPRTAEKTSGDESMTFTVGQRTAHAFSIHVLAAYAANLKGDIVLVTGSTVLGMVVNMMYLSITVLSCWYYNCILLPQKSGSRLQSFRLLWVAIDSQTRHIHQLSGQ